MADKELRRLNRRELLRMLIMQCEEAERLQREVDQTNARMKEMEESYERLKGKLNVKDERLDQKDATIAGLKRRIEELQQSKETEEKQADPDRFPAAAPITVVPARGEKWGRISRRQSGNTVLRTLVDEG